MPIDTLHHVSQASSQTGFQLMSKLLVLSISLTLLVAVGESVARGDAPAVLSAELQTIADGAAKRFPPEVLQTFKRGIMSVKATGIETSSKQVGDLAVDGTLANWKGDNVTLSELWSEGPVVMMWYRGGWCPYCNVQLRAMQKQLDAIQGAGAKLVILTPELPEKAKATAEANDLEMVALHDESLSLAKQYGIVFDLPAAIVPMYRDQLKLGSYNGNDAMELPLSATYVVNSMGRITYAYLNADYTKRAEPSEIVAAVKQAIR